MSTIFWVKRRRRQPVKMKIGRHRRHGAAGAGISRNIGDRPRRAAANRQDGTLPRLQARRVRLDAGQRVPEAQNEKVARVQSQRGRRSSVRRQIAIARRAVRLLVVIDGQIDAEDAVAAAKVLRLQHSAARRRPPAPIVERSEPRARGARRRGNGEQTG